MVEVFTPILTGILSTCHMVNSSLANLGKV